MAKLRFNRLFHSAVSLTYSSQSRLWSLLTLASVQGMPLLTFQVFSLGWLAPTSSIGPCRFIWLLRAESAAIALTEYTDDPSLTGPGKASSVCLTPERKERAQRAKVSYKPELSISLVLNRCQKCSHLSGCWEGDANLGDRILSFQEERESRWVLSWGVVVPRDYSKFRKWWVLLRGLVASHAKSS